jgi:hypothetical protein
MRFSRRRAWLTGAGILTALAVIIPGGVARATTLNGDWAPFTRCPVNDPSMLAADGANVVASCSDTASASGSITLGNTTAPLGHTDLQVGVLANEATFPPAYSAVAPSGGAIVGDPVTIPGGLLGLMCPGAIPVITQLCDSITNSTLNTVTATIEPAGSPSNLNLSSVFGTGQTIITVPVKIQLSNPILGNNCFIGSDSDPIVLNPQNSVAPNNGTFDTFDPNGTSDPNGALQVSTVNGGTIVDNTFSVPGATGCGGLLFSWAVDPVLDLKEGLPSASGHNHLTLNDPSISIAGYTVPSSMAPNQGQDLAAAWNSAITG